MLHAAVVVFQLQRTLARSIGAYGRNVNPTFGVVSTSAERRDQTALVTLFALRHDEQTRTRRTPPLCCTFIALRFGSQRRFVFRWEWLTENPVDGPFPQMSHLAAITGQR